MRELLKSIYLGDRACKAVLIDGFRRRVGIQVDEISRLQAGTTEWNFYNDENIVDGWIMFTGVARVEIHPSGALPADWIEVEDVAALSSEHDRGLCRVTLLVGCIDAAGEVSDGRIEIDATGVHLEDPTRPGVEVS